MKIIQIATADDKTGSLPYIYGLGDDGNLYTFSRNHGWVRVPDEEDGF